MKWLELIGKKIVAFRGYRTEKYGKFNVEMSFVLFDDKETYLIFHEQDPYDYHDCSSLARTVDIGKDANQWAKMFNKEDYYDEPNDWSF